MAQTKRKTPPVTKAAAAAAPDIPATYFDLLNEATQALVVTTPDWDAVDGSLSRFEKKAGKWKLVGDKVPVVVGKNGLAWDGAIDPISRDAKLIKREGDGRSPAGIFHVKEAFGFAPSGANSKLTYRPLTDSIECVDDASSHAYAQIVDRHEISNPDWSSSEKMRSEDVYKIGAVVDYNNLAIPAAGSCIFLHIWSGSGHGTAGCTAMDEAQLARTLDWLDANKHPVLVQLPANEYDRLRKSWQLP